MSAATASPTSPDALLDGLNTAQREAATTVAGPVAILAGAGTGKTRTISHRVAYAVATGAVDPTRILLVTFTEKAATEMVQRVTRLGLTGAAGLAGEPSARHGLAGGHGIAARTFHSAALAQLRYFWPLRNDGQPLPEVLGDPFRIVAPLARRLPGGYRFTPAKDLIDELSWAKSRRLTPDRYGTAGGALNRTPPIPLELFVRFYRDYERAKSRQGLVDFDDMLTLTVDLLEADEEAARLVRGRYSWFSVDEYQDTSPLQQRLLELWLGERRDLCVVGDEDQTIYTFAGATPDYLTGFARRFPNARVIPLLENYRSTPQVLALANRLIASTGRSKRLTTTRGSGPEPTVTPYPDGDAELAGIAGRVRELLRQGLAAREIAVLVRLNAQIAPIEAAFTRAGLPYRVRGQRFFDRREVRAAVEALGRVQADARGPALLASLLDVWRARLGFEPDAEPEGAEARERQAALSTLLAVVEEVVTAAGPEAGRDEVRAALERRAEAERSGASDGVELLTLHRAKGLEWDAVFVPSLEEGLLPVAQAKDDDVLVDEERRLLYVGITRARVHLALSWAEERASAQGRVGRRHRSRFLRAIAPGGGAGARGGAAGAGVPPGAPGSGVRRLPGAPMPPARPQPEDEAPAMTALRAWRTERARADGVPPYVIAHDSTLAEIVERAPRTLTELARVPGIGPAKLDKYGEEILMVRDEAE